MKIDMKIEGFPRLYVINGRKYYFRDDPKKPAKKK